MSSLPLEAAIQRAVGLDPSIDARNIQVRVVDGRATLTGIVDTLTAKEAAGRAATHVAGVREVENELTVSANHAVSDRELARKLDAALEELPADEHRTVGAVVSGGEALLVGHARWEAVVEAARRAAAEVAGVEAVIDEVQIDAGAPMDAASVRNRVMEALTQSGQVTPYQVQVAAVGGEVVLSGSVPDEKQRREAAAITAAVPGVSQVENRLVVGAGSERSR